MTIQRLSVLFLLLIPVAAFGEDDPRAARRAEADAIVLLRSATSATGPLPAAAPGPEIAYAPGVWIAAARARMDRAPTPATAGGKDAGKDGVAAHGELPHSKFGSPSEAYDIPSIQAKVTGLRFYEGGFDDVLLQQRVYAQRFASAPTRAIWWELGLTYPAPRSPKDFRLDARWRRQDGSVLADQAVDGRLEVGWTTSFHGRGWGATTTATWAPGTYTLEVVSEGRTVASGTFQVTSSAEVRGIRLHQNRVDDSGQKGVLIAFELETWGRLGQETRVGASVHFPDGTQLKDFDGKYVDANGFVAAHLDFHPQFDNTLWRQAQILFPYAQMHLLEGKHDLRIQLVAYDARTGAALARPPWVVMSVTWN